MPLTVKATPGTLVFRFENLDMNTTNIFVFNLPPLNGNLSRDRSHTSHLVRAAVEGGPPAGRAAGLEPRQGSEGTLQIVKTWDFMESHGFP